MLVDFSSVLHSNKTIAVALSGGTDSIALIHYAHSNARRLGFNVVALNVEHGIRGQSSIDDSNFVKNFCAKNSIPLVCYSVDSIEKSKQDKISIEQAARILRYQCFFDAIATKKCDLIATAHHQKDNAESILLSIFRGTGIKGLAGISEYSDKIIRPLLYTPKKDIEQYVKDNDLPFVTDQTNFSDEYTRNYVRLNVLPQIERVFPEAVSSISRLSKIAGEEDKFLDQLADEVLEYDQNSNLITINSLSNVVLIKRATIKALKLLGVTKDWEMAHVESVASLRDKQTGAMINLPKNIIAQKEYNNIVIYQKQSKDCQEALTFSLGTHKFLHTTISITKLSQTPLDFKQGFYADLDKIPKNAKIRNKLPGDLFTKFGGGTKSLSDYLTDLKIPLKDRDALPLIALDNQVYAIFGVAISDKIKVDKNTSSIVQLTKE